MTEKAVVQTIDQAVNLFRKVISTPRFYSIDLNFRWGTSGPPVFEYTIKKPIVPELEEEAES